MKKILSIALCLMLLISNNVGVKATTANNEFYLTTVDNIIGYTTDDSNLPSSGNYYFGLTSDGYVYYVPISKAIPVILNKGIGVTLKPQVLVDFIADYVEFGLVNSPYTPVYNGTTKIGHSFDDLTGKTILGSNNTTDYPINVPSGETNNVYNYYNQWYTDNGYNTPDYVNVETRPREFYTNKLNASLGNYESMKNFIDNGDFSLVNMAYNSNNMTYSYYGPMLTYSLDEIMIYCDTGYMWTDMCSAYNISSNKSTINFTDLLLSNTSIQTRVVKNNAIGTPLIRQTVSFDNNHGTNYTISDDSSNARMYFYILGYQHLPLCDKPYITIFKDMTVLNQVYNLTYAPLNFNTQQYYDYSSEDDNSVSTTSSQVDNSVTNNETIYNESAESFTEYYSENNYHIDNSVTISNTTEIVNNYYGSDDNGGDDSGGGSGDDDSGILDKLLDAIIDFFKNIGKIIGALLAGLFELLDSILDAIANINNSFEGIKNFLSSIFSWFPSEIVTLMVLGLGLALLASFITWFKK